MPLTWDQFSNTKAYNGLNRQDRAIAKLGFFNQVMQDSPEWADLTEDQRLKVTQNFFADEIRLDVQPERTAAGTLKDIGISAAKGVVGTGEAAIGLLDIPTFGLAGKGFEAIGGSFPETYKILESGYSPAQQYANQKVSEAEGFLDTAGTMLKYPSTIGHAVVESAPSVLGGGAVARGAIGLAPKLAPLVAGAIGEGVISAGQTAEQARQASDTGLIGPKEIGASVASGAITGAIAIAGGRIAKKFGFADPDTMLASGRLGTTQGSVARRIIEGGISEGVFEELPQSMQEQVWANAATGRPLMQGVSQAGAQGMFAGAAMGAGANVVARPPERESRLNMLRAPNIETVEKIQPETELTPPDIETVRPDQFEFPAQTPEEQAQMQRDIEIQRKPEYRTRVRNQAAIINADQAQQAQEQAQEREFRLRRSAQSSEQQRLEQNQQQIEATNIEAENEIARNRFNALEDLYDLAHDAGRRGERIPRSTSRFIGRLTTEERQKLNDYYESGKHVADVLKRNEIDEDQEDAEGIFREQEPSGEEIPQGRDEPGGGIEEGETQRRDKLLVQTSQGGEQVGLEPSGPSPAASTQKETTSADLKKSAGSIFDSAIKNVTNRIKTLENEINNWKSRQYKKHGGKVRVGSYEEQGDTPWKPGVKKYRIDYINEKRRRNAISNLESQLDEERDLINQIENLKNEGNLKSSDNRVLNLYEVIGNKSPRPQTNQSEQGSRADWDRYEKFVEDLNFKISKEAEEALFKSDTDILSILGLNQAQRETPKAPSPKQSVDDFNTKNPGNSIKYDGIQDRSAINKPPLYSFTAYEGPLKGASFNLENPTAESIKSKVDELIGLRDNLRSKTEERNVLRQKAIDEGIPQADIEQAEATGIRDRQAERADAGIQAKPEGRKAIGRAWTGNQWKPITEQIEIKRGKNKGKMRVTFAGGRKRVVAVESIRSFEAQEKEPQPDTGKIKRILKDQTGSSQLATDIINYGITLKQKGESFRNFRAAMHQKFLDIWEKIKGHMRALWGILSNERGQVDVYHGSPHRFEKFSTEKIGAGEGAQSFGWGLYFTDKKGIAEHYAKSLSQLSPDKFRDKFGEDRVEAYLWAKGDKKRAISNMRERINEQKNYIKQYGPQGESKETLNRMVDVLNKMESGSFDASMPEPKTYKATLHEGKDPSEYTWLDWDKEVHDEYFNKIAGQLEKNGQTDSKLYESIKNKSYDVKGTPLDIKQDGDALYAVLADELGSQKEASLFLLRAGIDGIRYRADTLGGIGGKIDRGTNYVVFDENAVTIKEINGQLLDALKNEKGSSELVNGIVSFGAQQVQKGVKSFSDFTAAMKERFSAVWEKIKNHMRQLWSILNNQRGEITIERTKKEIPQKETEVFKPEGEVFNKEPKQQIESDQLTTIETLKGFLQKPKLTQKAKNDLSYIGDLLLGLPSFFAEKIPAVKKIFDASQSRQDEFHEGINWMENHDNANVIEQWKRLKGSDKDQASKYLVQNDRDMTGFRVAQRKSGKWVAMDREGIKIAEFESELTEDMIDKGEVAAVEKIVQAETEYLNSRGFSPEQVAAIISFRLSTNKGFDTLFASMRKLVRTYKENNIPLPKIPVTENEKTVHIDLEQAMARMNDIRGYYFPRIRKPGKYILRAFKKGQYNILETFSFARRMNVRRLELEKQGYTVDTGENTQLGEDVFEMAGKLVATQQIVNAALDNVSKGIKASSKEEIDSLEKEVESIFASALAEQIANVIRERGSRVHMTRRSQQVYIGYEEDPETVIAKYIRGISAGEAKRNMVMKMLRSFTGTDVSWKDFKAENPDATYDDYRDMVKENMIDQREQKTAFKWAKAYIAENTRNQEPADRAIGIVKGVAVAKYLAFRVFSAPLVNLTALPTSAVASMKAAGIPYVDTFRHLTSAARGYGRYRLGKTLSAGQQRIFDYIRQKGWDNPQFNSEALTTLRGAIGRRYDKVIEYGMWTFSESERLNRAATIAGAYNGLAKMNTGEDFEALMDKAKKISDDSHGIYNRGNYPYIALGRHPAALVTKAFYVFRTFSHTYLNNLYRVGFKENDKIALAHMLIAPAVIAGAGASVLTPLISIILKALGIDEPEEQAYLKIGEMFGPSAENVARFGVTAAIPGGGLSMKGSLSIGITDIPTELRVKDFLGAPGSVIDEIFHIAPAAIFRGDVAKGVEKLLPTGFGNLIRAYREGTEGITTRNNAPVFYGDDQIKLNLVESIYRGMSFNPARIAGMREKQYRERMLEEKYRQRKTDIYAKIKRYVIEGSKNTSKWAELIGEIEQYNEDANRWKFSNITKKSIRTNLKRSFKPSRRERMRQ